MNDLPDKKPTEEKVDFGYERVSPTEKTQRVGEVFRSVARKYDVMNDLMSLGMHRAMKHLARDLSGVRSGDKVLDLAGGTGDMAARFAPLVAGAAGSDGMVVLADINEAMLDEGRGRLLERGLTHVRYAQVNAEDLPFASGTFACVTIAFGLRNVARKERALREMHRVLAPNGRLLVLEFSKPRHAWLREAYGLWQGLWPTIGRAITGDAGPYQYLVDSIATHPDQETLTAMITAAGFSEARCYDLMDGIVALHRGVAAKPAT